MCVIIKLFACMAAAVGPKRKRRLVGFGFFVVLDPSRAHHKNENFLCVECVCLFVSDSTRRWQQQQCVVQWGQDSRIPLDLGLALVSV